jgi:hypothetical protein
VLLTGMTRRVFSGLVMRSVARLALNRYRHCGGRAVFVYTADCQIPLSRVLIEKQTVPQLVKKFLEFVCR